MNGGLQRDFTGSVKICLNKYAEFTGRAPRSELWWWLLFTLMLDIGVTIIAYLLDAPGGGHFFLHTLRGLLALALLLPGLGVAVRRMHDINKSGWWLLLALVPVFGAIVVLIFYCLPGTPGANRFGPDPLAADAHPAV